MHLCLDSSRKSDNSVSTNEGDEPIAIGKSMVEKRSTQITLVLSS